MFKVSMWQDVKMAHSWKDAWMDECKSHFEDCLQQSKIVHELIQSV
jgi:hypothetical protein